MPKAYWVVAYHAINDKEAFQAYGKVAGPAILASGGRFLARGNPAKVYEAGKEQRVVLIEFDDVEKAVAAHDSPGYTNALAVLGKNSVVRDVRIIEGAE